MEASVLLGRRLFSVQVSCYFRSFLLLGGLLLPGYVAAAPADYLISLVRHGDRSPIGLDDQAELWPIGPGQLTRHGMTQMYLLGGEIRSHYFGNDFPETWTPKLSRHYAKGLNRTVQSASALLQGFYSPGRIPAGLPGNLQLPPVFSTPATQDFLFSSHRLCPRYRQLIQQLADSELWQKKKKQYGKKMTSWADLAEVKADIYPLIWLMDRAAIHMNYGLPLPDGLTEQDALELKSLFDWVLSQIGRDKPVAQLVITPFIKAMISDLQEAARCLSGQSKKCLRWTLYVASDLNLMTFMGLLGVHRDSNVDYAAHLEIKLNWSRGSPGIALFFNNKPLSVPGCGVQCSLDQWLEILNKSLPDSWESLCSGEAQLQPEALKLQPGQINKANPLKSKINNQKTELYLVSSVE